MNKINRNNIAPIIFMMFMVILFFGKVILSGNTIFGHDFSLFFLPLKQFILDSINDHGLIPKWNPYILSGTPMVSNMQVSLYYPLGFLYYIISPGYAYLYSSILHIMLGSIFMFYLMRTLSVSRTGALFSSIIFSYNGFFLGHLYAGHLTFVQNYIWIPLIFNFLYRSLKTGRLTFAVLTGIVLGVQILGGFPQIAFYTILGIIAFGIYHLFVSFESPEKIPKRNIVLNLAIIMVVGFSLSAIQLLPTMEFVTHSTRAGGINYEFATYDSLHPLDLLSFAIPGIFGSPVDNTYWRSIEGWHFWETCGYVGITSLVLIFFKPLKDQHRKLWWFFIILSAGALFLALGKNNPFYPIIHLLPGFKSFRIPAQIIFLYVFGLGAVSGICINGLEERKNFFSRSAILVTALIGSVLLIIALAYNYYPAYFLSLLLNNLVQGPAPNFNSSLLYQNLGEGINNAALVYFSLFLVLLLGKKQKIRSNVFGFLVLAIIVVDLWKFGGQFVEPYNNTSSEFKDSVVKQLDTSPVKGRSLIQHPAFIANDGLVYRFPSVMGYDPLMLKRYLNYIQASQGVPLNDHIINLRWVKNNADSKLLELLNVSKYVNQDSIRTVNNGTHYARIVSDVVTKEPDSVLPFMLSDKFKPDSMVVFESSRPKELQSHYYNKEFEYSCSVKEYKADSMRMTVHTEENGYLVLSEIYYPGWKAQVDGKPVEIQRGNYIFRVIPIEKGTHEIYMYFVSWPYRIGLIISVISLLSSLTFLFYSRRKGKINGVTLGDG